MRVAGVFANIEIEREHGTRFDGLFLFFFFFLWNALSVL